MADRRRQKSFEIQGVVVEVERDFGPKKLSFYGIREDDGTVVIIKLECENSRKSETLKSLLGVYCEVIGDTMTKGRTAMTALKICEVSHY